MTKNGTMMGQPFTLNLNLDPLSEFSKKIVRRTAAFLAIGINSGSKSQKQDMLLPGETLWRFFPDPLPDEVLRDAKDEFRNWVIGNALRELDSGFNTFLDDAWNITAWSKLHGSTVKSNYQIKTVDDITNAASKYEMLMEQLGAQAVDLENLRSLSKLRNCLTHAHGVVTKRHTNVDGVLAVRWRGLEMRLQQGDSYVVIPADIPEAGLQAPNPAEPADVVGVIVNREKVFPVGKKALLTPADLHEICWNQLQRTDEIIAAMLKDMRQRGIGEMPTRSQT